MDKIALVTGATGQDGTYLCELLNHNKYQVHALVRRASVPQPRLKLLKNVTIHEGDITDFTSVHKVMDEVCPNHVYNLAAQSHVGTSFKMPEYTEKVNSIGLLNVLETVRQDFPRCRVYQASTSELFGKALETPQNENTPFNPISPYAVAKLAAHNTAKYYREYYGVFVSCGILFNHESPRRGEEFLTQKVIQAVKNIKAGKQKELILGDLSPKRDWGYAPEYIEAMHDMLCHNTPDDFVIATGESNSVRDFVRYAFKLAGLGNYKQYVTENVDKRPAEVFTLCGDSTKALDKLGWKAKTTMKDLIKIMLEQDPDENVWEWE